MDLEKEVQRLKVIVDSEATAVGLLETLNGVLLRGVEPLSVIEKLSRLEMTSELQSLNARFKYCMQKGYLK